MPASITAKARATPDTGARSPRPRVKKVVPLKYKSSEGMDVARPEGRTRRALQQGEGNNQAGGPKRQQEQQRERTVETEKAFVPAALARRACQPCPGPPGAAVKQGSQPHPPRH